MFPPRCLAATKPTGDSPLRHNISAPAQGIVLGVDWLCGVHPSVTAPLSAGGSGSGSCYHTQSLRATPCNRAAAEGACGSIKLHDILRLSLSDCVRAYGVGESARREVQRRREMRCFVIKSRCFNRKSGFFNRKRTVRHKHPATPAPNRPRARSTLRNECPETEWPLRVFSAYAGSRFTPSSSSSSLRPAPAPAPAPAQPPPSAAPSWLAL